MGVEIERQKAPVIRATVTCSEVVTDQISVYVSCTEDRTIGFWATRKLGGGACERITVFATVDDTITFAEALLEMAQAAKERAQ